MNREQLKEAMLYGRLEDGFYWFKRNGRERYEVCQYNRIGYGQNVVLTTGTAHALGVNEIEEFGEFIGSEPGECSRGERSTPTHRGGWGGRRAGKWFVALLDRERAHPNTRVQLQYDPELAFVSERDVSFGPFVGMEPPVIEEAQTNADT